MKVDNSLLAITHYAQLLFLFTLIGGLLAPLIIWILKRDEIRGMNEHGKEILNFQISTIIYLGIGWITSFLLIGFVLIFIIFCLIIYCSIKGGVKASNGEFYKYPLTIKFL